MLLLGNGMNNNTKFHWIRVPIALDALSISLVKFKKMNKTNLFKFDKQLKLHVPKKNNTLNTIRAMNRI